MFRRIVATVGALVTAAALTVTACGAPPGGDNSGSSNAGAAAIKAAKELGINLGTCANDISKKFGSTAKIGQSLALSGGPAAIFAPVGGGTKAAFGKLSESSDLPTKFELVTKDDQFQPAKTLAATQELIGKDKVALMTSIVGTGQVAAVQKELGSECVPLVPGISTATAVNNPAEFPWTVNGTMTARLDVATWVANVGEKFPDGAKIALFTGNTETGKEYITEINRALKGTKNKVVSEQTIEGTDAAAPSSQVTTMRSSGADVLFTAPTGGQCPSLLSEVANQGWTPAIYLTYTCGNAGALKVAGKAANGVMVNLWTKDAQEKRWANDPDIVAVTNLLKKYSPGTPLNTYAYSGYYYAEPLMEAIRVAAKSDLGLSPLGILYAARHLDFQPKMLLPGIKFALDGDKDKIAIESAELSSFNIGTVGFDPIKLYNFEGKLSD